MRSRPTKTVLVVDFDDAVRQQCCAMLRSEGFDVHSGATHAELQTLVRAHPPDLLIIGLFLADGPGYRVFADALVVNTPVVGLTDVFQGPSVRQLLKQRHPFLELLDKPLSGANLVDLMRVHFGSDYPDSPTTSAVDDARRAPSNDDESPEGSPLMHNMRAQDSVEGALESLSGFDSGFPAARDDRQGRGFQRVRTSPKHRPATIAAVPERLDWRAIPEQGDLETASFAALLSRMMHTRYTGSLRLWRERVRKIVYFRSGCLAAIRSNLLYECLGNLLVRDGIIDDATAAESLARAQAEGLRHGEMLLQMGAMTSTGLERALVQQLNERVLDVFGWTEARYRVHALDTIPAVTDHSRLDTLRLIVRGVLERMPPGRIMVDLEECLPMTLRLAPADVSIDEIGLSASHMEVVQELRRGGTLLELVARFEQSAQVYQVIYALVVLGLASLET